ASTEQPWIAQRVEGQCLADGRVDRIDLRRLGDELADSLRTTAADVGAGIDQHEALQTVGVTGGVDERVERAHRLADEPEALDAEMLDEALDVAPVGLRLVVHRRRPLALAVSALVEGDAVVFGAESEADDVPRMRVEGAAVEKEDQRPPALSPVQVVEPHPADHEVALLLQYDLGHGDAR